MAATASRVVLDTLAAEFRLPATDGKTIKIMTVEHNYVEANRQAVFELLIERGFVRLFEPLSKFDDWYVKRSILGP
jgi:hypothetical protein